jgi:hypothetical protein
MPSELETAAKDVGALVAAFIAAGVMVVLNRYEFRQRLRLLSIPRLGRNEGREIIWASDTAPQPEPHEITLCGSGRQNLIDRAV